ncbi:EcoKI restriction-modification system protein HsdS [Pseudoalteromonas sp. P1-13-1a]|uniref:restriction endonuclease subunit S n=1 Tax=Pseudoalteromonas sp. P1-13-1a TaxID=1723756 RepID=UPI0006D67119|nr:restriction endonuclease subunit S [Pseudoalteromonas sp. P1-13-1a]KPZ52760.1 EcoKI restriction-modification system protein HsdS [Pseudoalteromonas sp. P1-13-1a]
MGSNWKICELDKVIKKRNQGVNTTTEKVKYSSEGIIVIRANNILSGRIDYRDCAFVDEETFSRIKDTCKPRKGDVLYTNIGSQFGTAAKVNVDFEFAIAWNVLRIQTSNEVDSDFLVYLLNNPVHKRYIQSLNSSSTMPFVSGKVVGGVAFKFPSIAEQIKIKNVLKPFEHRIELNRQTNQTLEQMAQALFKSWFVDFDPVFDNLLASVDFKLENLETSLPDELKQKAQRRLAALNSLENAAEIKTSLSALAHELQAQLPTKEATQAAVQVSEKAAETPVKANFNGNPKILAQHANTHAHFPNEFEQNEQLGWIPKGWEVESIYESIDIVYGAPFKSKQFNNDAIGHPIIRIRDLKTGSPQNWSDELHPKRTLIKAGDIVVGMDAEFRATVWSGEDGFLNQRLFLAKGRKKYISNLFIKYSLAPLLAFQEHTQVGTTVAHLGKKEIDRFEILMPSNSILKQSSDFFEDIKDKIVQNYKSTTQLTKLRDTLLPKLISGELQIPDVAIDEEVVD